MFDFYKVLVFWLTGELIVVYPCSGVRCRPSFTMSKIFSSETTRPIKAKLHVEEHPLGGGRKFV